jgi:hypothetical protein
MKKVLAALAMLAGARGIIYFSLGRAKHDIARGFSTPYSTGQILGVAFLVLLLFVGIRSVLRSQK